MDYATKEIAEYNPITCPPFYTLVFNRKDFLNPQTHFNLIKNLKSHEDIGHHPKFRPLSGRGFIVGCHGENISTSFNHRFKGRVLNKDEAELLMIGAGILNSRPLKFSLSWRIRLRKLFNLLPFHDTITELYHRLPLKIRIL